MSDSVWPHRWQPTRLPRPWDSPGKNIGVGCHFLLWCIKVKSESDVAQSCPIPNNPMDYSLPGSSIHGIFQARVLEWVAVAFSWLYLIGHNTFNCGMKCMISQHDKKLVVVSKQQNWCLTFYKVIKKKSLTESLMLMTTQVAVIINADGPWRALARHWPWRPAMSLPNKGYLFFLDSLQRLGLLYM